MTDIDFDELDKAVNSLMGKAVSTDPDDVVAEKELNISPTLKPGEKPTYDKLVEVAKGIGSETLLTEGERTVMGDSKLPTTELPIAELDAIQSGQDNTNTLMLTSTVPAIKRPSSGRSMDVVRTSPTKQTAKTMPSLVVPGRLSSVPSSEPVPEVAEPEQAVTVAPVPQTVEPQRLTPFLPDTKVEKRPLGTSDAAPAESPVGEVKDSEPEHIVPDEPANDSNIDSTDKEVNIVDAKNQDDQKNPEALDAPLSTQGQQLEAVESAEVVKDETIADSVRAVESGDTEKLNNGSIAQQYQATQTESPDTAGAIYDVKDYHQALGHPVKQKSGWGVIVLILVIIIACAVIGAAVYFILGAGL